MMTEKRILAVVPARGGSKGIPLKNLREVGGKSLVARVGDVIAQLPEIDRAVVSTDHEGIAAAAIASGISAPFRRPEHLSGDRVGDYDVLVHALNTMEAMDDCRYDIVVMLQPTSPLRTPEQVRTVINMLIKDEWDSVWTVSPTDLKAHPLKQLKIGTDGTMAYYDPRGAEIIARQQLEPVYHRNGIAYAMTRECLIEHKSIMGRKSSACVVAGLHVSIDTESDLSLVEAIVTDVNYQNAKGISS
jgi:CMP-N-acetylneuraminic acid synthetase